MKRKLLTRKKRHNRLDSFTLRQKKVISNTWTNPKLRVVYYKTIKITENEYGNRNFKSRVDIRVM